MDMGLSKHGIDQGRLAVVNMGDDGDVADIVSAVVRGTYSRHGDDASLQLAKSRLGSEAQTPQYTRSVFAQTSDGS